MRLSLADEFPEDKRRSDRAFTCFFARAPRLCGCNVCRPALVSAHDVVMRQG